jgi:hypothetical protein
MDQAQIQLQISKGLAKAASIIGTGLTQYRPTTPLDPLLAGSAIGVVNCAIDTETGLTFQAPAPPGHPFALLLADPGLLQAGDYLVGIDTYFVSRIEPLQPAWCVLCNMTLDILDTSQSSSAGTNSYGGATSANDTLLARGWPMSMLAKTRGEQDVTKLPSDTRSAFFEVFMPSIPGFSLGLGLCLQDVNDQIYLIMSFETTAYGCKLIVGLATT